MPGMSPERFISRRLARAVCMACAGLLAIGAVLNIAGPARGADPFDALKSDFRSSKIANDAPRVARYLAAEGGPGFVLDLTGAQPLMKFDRSEEILVLTAAPGPRNDTLYKLENGVTVLRRTGAGGLTLFTTARVGGVPAFRKAPSLALDIPPATRAMLSVVADASSLRVFLASGADIRFDYAAFAALDDAQGRAAAADAIRIASIALEEIAGESAGAAALARKIDAVEIRRAAEPSARVDAGALLISINSELGPAGRPSSYAIRAQLEAAL